MKLFTFFIVGFISPFIGNQANADESGGGKIVNGYSCPIRSHPYMVSVRIPRNFKHYCGGTLLNELWILSAAHCIVQSKGKLVVVGLSVITNDDAKEENRRTIVEAYIKYHPYDVGVAKLNKPVKASRDVGFVRIPNSKLDLAKIAAECKEALTIGWGLQTVHNPEGAAVTVNPPAAYDPHLKCAKLSYFDRDECVKKFNSFERGLQPDAICAYDPAKDACYGDSGGPLLCNDVQYAITSQGYGCAWGHIPGAYVRVDYHLDFIRDHISAKIGPKTNSGESLLVHKKLYHLTILLYTIFIMPK